MSDDPQCCCVSPASWALLPCFDSHLLLSLASWSVQEEERRLLHEDPPSGNRDKDVFFGGKLFQWLCSGTRGGFGWLNYSKSKFSLNCKDRFPKVNISLPCPKVLVGKCIWNKNWSKISFLRWNPLRKKSGLMSVMHAQTKKGRVVSKHGRINTFHRKEEVRHDKHRSKATLSQWTSIASCSLFLTDTSRTSSPPWLNSHGLGLCSASPPLSSYPGLASLWPGELFFSLSLCSLYIQFSK